MKQELNALLRGLESGIVRHVDARHLWRIVSRGRRPSAKTLDKLALLAGCQNWQELRETMRGENDGAFGIDDTTPPEPGK